MAPSPPARLHFGGALRSCESHGSVRLFEVEYEEARTCPEHLHSTSFFSLVLCGNYTEKIGKLLVTLMPFDLGFHPCGTTHSDSVNKDKTRFFMIELREQWMDLFRKEKEVIAKPFLCSAETSWLAVQLLRQHRDGSLHSPLAVEEWVLGMLATIGEKHTSSESKQPRWLPRVLELLSSEFQRRITLGQVAQEVGLHPIYLSRAFRRHRGENLGQCVGRLRVQFAQRLLWNPEIPIVEIALQAGFTDQAQLTRVFKRITGTTPFAFRKLALSADSATEFPPSRLPKRT